MRSCCVIPADLQEQPDAFTVKPLSSFDSRLDDYDGDGGVTDELTLSSSSSEEDRELASAAEVATILRRSSTAVP